MLVLAVGTTGIMFASAVFAQAAAAQPSITSAPNPISTNPVAGQTILTANPAAGSTAPAYVWYDCDSSGNNCVTPVGSGTTYSVANSDIGSTIIVQETDPTAGVSNSAPTLQVVAPPPPVPSNSGTPVISGTAQEGQTLTVAQATWNPPPPTSSITDYWQSCNSGGCATVAQGGSYTLQASDVGNTIVVQEYASDSTGQAGPVASNTVGPVTPLPPANVNPPTISGSAAVDQTLFANQGTWTENAFNTYTFQWYDCPDTSGTGCSVIPGANSQSYTVTSGDIGHTIDVLVTATNGGGSASASSSTTSKVGLFASSTSLLTLPTSAVTNQNVAMVATVTSSSSSAPVSGTVDFQDGGAPISGCTSVPITTSGQSAQVTCQASFSGASSPRSLTASFTPSSGSILSGSTSSALNLTVGRDNTTTQLDVPNTVVTANHPITFTASVAAAHLGSVQPTGTVQFQDNGAAIPGCASQPLAQSQGIESAQCTVTYSKRGTHSISAVYGGDAAFNGSNSASPSPQSLTVIRLGPRVRGEITTKMRWTFRFTPHWTQVLALLIHKASVGTKIVLTCKGKGCPFKKRSLRIRRHHRNLDVARLLRRARLRPGTVLIVEFSRRNWIGKVYVFRIRSGHGPHYQIGCLRPGSSKFGKVCT